MSNTPGSLIKVTSGITDFLLIACQQIRRISAENAFHINRESAREYSCCGANSTGVPFIVRQWLDLRYTKKAADANPEMEEGTLTDSVSQPEGQASIPVY